MVYRFNDDNICLICSLFQLILDNPGVPCKGEEKLAALTAGERTPWAKARKQFFSSGVNKASLDAIEKSSFVLVLDEEKNAYDPVCIYYLNTANVCTVNILSNTLFLLGAFSHLKEPFF